MTGVIHQMKNEQSTQPDAQPTTQLSPLVWHVKNQIYIYMEILSGSRVIWCARLGYPNYLTRGSLRCEDDLKGESSIPVSLEVHTYQDSKLFENTGSQLW